MRRICHPDFTYRPWSDERKRAATEAARKRLGTPDGHVRIFGVYVPEDLEHPLRQYAGWVRVKRGWDAAQSYVQSCMDGGTMKPSPEKKASDWALVEELMAEHMTREEVAEYLGVDLGYLKERMSIHKRMGRSEYGSGRRARVKRIP